MNYSFFDLNGLRATMGRGRDGQMMLETFSGDVGAAGGVIASVAKGDGNGAAIGAATFLIPVRLPGAKIVGEVGAEIAGAATKQGVLKSEEILKSVQNAAAETTGHGAKAADSALQVPGRVQSRINLRNGSQAEGAGWNHLTNEHYSSVKNKSQFTVPQEELRQILQSKEVVGTPVTRVLPSADGPRYVREIDVGRNVGTDKFNNYSPTTKMTVLTDKAGNLVSAFPGVLK